MRHARSDMIYRVLFPAVWLLWGFYWLALSRDVKATREREPPLSRVLHVAPLVAAVLLLSAPPPALAGRFMPLAVWPFWVGLAVAVGGLLFTVWARRHIARNWSGIVTIKEDHELVTSGPYAIVRHPIYTGLLIGLAGSALARGDWSAVLAVAIAGAALWRKLRVEERWMRGRFGAAYEAYSARVPPLIPSLRAAMRI